MFSITRKDIPPHLLKYFKPRQIIKPKDDLMIPARVAFALRADGWYLRSDCIWHKPNPMPESVTDRPTKAHEYLFLLSKRAQYYYDADAIREDAARDWANCGGSLLGATGWTTNAGRNDMSRKPGTLADTSSRNKRSVWTVPTEPSPLPHYAMYPQALIEPCILAGAPRECCAVCGAPYERQVEREAMEVRRTARAEAMGEYGRTCTSGTMTKPPTRTTLGFASTCTCDAGTRPGVVLDPFMGTGTTALVAIRLGREYVGIDLDASSVALAEKRIRYAGDDRRLVAEERAGVEQVPLFAPRSA